MITRRIIIEVEYEGDEDSWRSETDALDDMIGRWEEELLRHPWFIDPSLLVTFESGWPKPPQE